MSDESKPPESKDDPLSSLTSLDLGPAWARGESEGKKGGAKEGREKRTGGGGRRRDEGRRDEGRRDEGRRDDPRGERKGGRGRRDDNRGRDNRGKDNRGKDNRGNDNRGRRSDSRDRGDRGRRQDTGRGRRQDDRRGDRSHREETPAPEGVVAQVMPVEEGLDGLAKEIMAGGRTYSVFDLAKLVLGARERFNVGFKCKGEVELYRCRKDNSLWLTKAEALAQLWRADWRKDYYEEVVTDAPPPKGNFQAVARCGLSGEWLGPPNYHGYQTALMQLHRERFGHMSLDAYKRKVKMERGEEAVAAWLDKMSKRINFRATGGVRPAESGAAEADAASEETGSEEAPEEGATTEGEAATMEGEAPSADETAESGEAPVAEASPEETGSEEAVADESDAEEASPAEPEPAAESDAVVMEDAREVERHFLENHFEEVFLKTNKAWVSGNISGPLLSPGLLTLLRETVAEERRYPGKLTPMLCRQLSGRHVAVFKWRRKLKAGPSRPHPIPDDITIADRPQSLLSWLGKNPGKKIEKLWHDLLPDEVSDEEKRGWYHDLHWLLNQGYALLMADSTLHLSKKPGEGEDQPDSRSKAKKKSARKGERPPKKPVPSAPTEAAKPAPEAAERRVSGGDCSGLYAQSARTLAGTPKGAEPLSNRGLQPRPRPAEPEEEAEEEEAAPW